MGAWVLCTNYGYHLDECWISFDNTFRKCFYSKKLPLICSHINWRIWSALLRRQWEIAANLCLYVTRCCSWVCGRFNPLKYFCVHDFAHFFTSWVLSWKFDLHCFVESCNNLFKFLFHLWVIGHHRHLLLLWRSRFNWNLIKINSHC